MRFAPRFCRSASVATLSLFLAGQVLVGCTASGAQEDPTGESATEPPDPESKPSSNEITAFTFPAADNPSLAEDVSASIVDNVISVELPAGTDLTALIPRIDYLGASVLPASNVAADFTHPVGYSVTAADGSTRSYVVNVTVASWLPRDTLADITKFTVNGVNATIKDLQITLTVPHGTGLTAIAPVITTTGVSISPASGEKQDFSSPVVYTVTAEDGSTKVYTATISEEAAPCDKTVYNAAVAFASANPTRDGKSWSGWCASLVFRFGKLPAASARASAIIAYHASSIVSTDPSKAKIGAVHWWDIGEYGHVGVDLLGGGKTVFMASSHLSTSWATALGINSVSGYNAGSGAKYLGWSMDYAGGKIPGGGGDACGAPAALPPGAIAPSGTVSTGEPDVQYWARLQTLAAKYAYTGPINGIMGPNSWAGVQRAMKVYGYTGPDNGIPGVNTYKAMQTLAAKWGYTGPVNGVLGPNSYKGIAKYLNTL